MLRFTPDSALGTRDGEVPWMLVVVDGFTRECLAIRVGRGLTSDDVLAVLAELFVARGVPERIRSDNRPEFVSGAVREWLGRLGVGALFIEPGSPWESGYVESLNGKLRDELLNAEVFHSLRGAQALIGSGRSPGRVAAPQCRPAALGARPPAPEAVPWPAWPPSRPAAGQDAGAVHH